ncbi:hypothetical protein IAQ61_003982 [Plenodomus lingam]|uniref:uncharacterized protein n=1 Tax=Leptosphaeria maculans TaxID=5022 RepID=UPI00332EC610|nr:hypothetical protein IAQ61_003982 [Plenodomus lingam]
MLALLNDALKVIETKQKAFEEKGLTHSITEAVRPKMIKKLKDIITTVTGKPWSLFLDTILWVTNPGSSVKRLLMGFNEGGPVFARSLNGTGKHETRALAIGLKNSTKSFNGSQLKHTKLAGVLHLFTQEKVGSVLSGDLIESFVKAVFVLRGAAPGRKFKNFNDGLKYFKDAISVINHNEDKRLTIMERIVSLLMNTAERKQALSIGYLTDKYLTFTQPNLGNQSAGVPRAIRNCKLPLKNPTATSISANESGSVPVHGSSHGSRPTNLKSPDNEARNQNLLPEDSALIEQDRNVAHEEVSEVHEMLERYVRTLQCLHHAQSANIPLFNAVKKYINDTDDLENTLASLSEDLDEVQKRIAKEYAASIKRDLEHITDFEVINTVLSERRAEAETNRQHSVTEMKKKKTEMQMRLATIEAAHSDAAGKLREMDEKIRELTARKIQLEGEGGFALGVAFREKFANLA